MITNFHQFLKKTCFPALNLFNPSQNTANRDSPNTTNNADNFTSMSRVKASRRGKRSPSKVDSSMAKSKSILSYFSPTRKSLSPPLVTKKSKASSTSITPNSKRVLKDQSTIKKEETCLNLNDTPTKGKVMSPSTPDSTTWIETLKQKEESSSMKGMNHSFSSTPRVIPQHVIPSATDNGGSTSAPTQSPISSPSTSLVVSEHSNGSMDKSLIEGIKSPSTPTRKRKGKDKNQMSLFECIQLQSNSPSSKDEGSSLKEAQQSPTPTKLKLKVLDKSPPPKARRTKSNSSPRNSCPEEFDVNSTTTPKESIRPTGGKPSVASSKIKPSNPNSKSQPKNTSEIRVKFGSFDNEPCLGLVRVPSHECSLRELCQFLYDNDPLTTQKTRRSKRQTNQIEKPTIFPLFQGAILGRMEIAKSRSLNKVPIDVPFSAVGVSRTQVQVQSISTSSSSTQSSQDGQPQKQNRIRITRTSTNRTLCRYLQQQQKLFPSVTVICMKKASNAFRAIKPRVKEDSLRNRGVGEDLSILQPVVKQGMSVLLRVGDVIEFDAYNRPFGSSAGQSNIGNNRKQNYVSTKKKSEHVFRVVAYYPREDDTQEERNLESSDLEVSSECAENQQVFSTQSIVETSTASPLLNTTQEINLLNVSASDDISELGGHDKMSRKKSSEIDLPSLDSLKIVSKLSSSPASSIKSAEILQSTSFDEPPSSFNQEGKGGTNSTLFFDSSKVACKLDLTSISNTNKSQSRLVANSRKSRASLKENDAIKQTNQVNGENDGFSPRPQIGDRFRARFNVSDLFGRRGSQREIWIFGEAVDLEEKTKEQYKVEVRFDDLTDATFEYPSKDIQKLRLKESAHGSLLYEVVHQNGKVSFAYDTNPSSLYLGDLVQCRHQNGLYRGRFYLGRVAAIRNDKRTFDVAYLDGEVCCLFYIVSDVFIVVLLICFEFFSTNVTFPWKKAMFIYLNEGPTSQQESGLQML